MHRPVKRVLNKTAHFELPRSQYFETGSQYNDEASLRGDQYNFESAETEVCTNGGFPSPTKTVSWEFVLQEVEAGEHTPNQENLMAKTSLITNFANLKK